MQNPFISITDIKAVIKLWFNAYKIIFWVLACRLHFWLPKQIISGQKSCRLDAIWWHYVFIIMIIHTQNLLCEVLGALLNGCDVDLSHDNPDSCFSLYKKKVRDPKIHILQNGRYSVLCKPKRSNLHFSFNLIWWCVRQ